MTAAEIVTGLDHDSAAAAVAEVAATASGHVGLLARQLESGEELNGTVAYCAAADRLDDKTMTALADGNEILGRLGAIMLTR